MSDVKAGTIVKSPEGRRFRVHADTGCDSKGQPLVVLVRMDRQPREQSRVTRPRAEVESWQQVQTKRGEA